MQALLDSMASNSKQCDQGQGSSLSQVFHQQIETNKYQCPGTLLKTRPKHVLQRIRIGTQHAVDTFNRVADQLEELR